MIQMIITLVFFIHWTSNFQECLLYSNEQQISTVDVSDLIVLAMPKQLKHPHPQCLFVVNWNTDLLSCEDFI